MPSIVRYAGPGVAVEASTQHGIRLLLLPLPAANDRAVASPVDVHGLVGVKEVDRHPLQAIDMTRFVHLDYDCGHDNCNFRPCGLVSLAMAMDVHGFAQVVYVHAAPPPSTDGNDVDDGDAICSFSLRVWKPACLPRYRALPNNIDLVAVCGAPPPPSYCRPSGCPAPTRSHSSSPQPQAADGSDSGGHACAAPPQPGSFLTYEGKAVEDYTTRATLVGITAVGTLQFSVVGVSCVAEKPFTVCGGVHRSPCFGVIGKAIAVIAHPDTTTLATVIIDRGQRGTGFVDVDCQNAAGIRNEQLVARRITSIARHPDNVSVFGSDDGFAGILGPASMPLVTPTPIKSLIPGEVLRFAPLLPLLPIRKALTTTLGRALFARSDMPPLALIAAGSSPASNVAPFLMSVRDPCKAKREAAAADRCPELAIRGSLQVAYGDCNLTLADFGCTAAFIRPQAVSGIPIPRMQPLAVWNATSGSDECGAEDDDAACCAGAGAHENDDDHDDNDDDDDDEGKSLERPRPAQPRQQLAATQQGAAMIVASGTPLDSADPVAAGSEVQLQAVLRAELTIRCDALLPAGCAERPTQLMVHTVGGGVRLLLCVARAAHCQPLVLGMFGSAAAVGSSGCCAASVADAGICDSGVDADDCGGAPVVQCVARSVDAPSASPSVHVFALHSNGALSRCLLHVDPASESVRVVEPLRKLISSSASSSSNVTVGTLTAIPAPHHGGGQQHETSAPIFAFVDGHQHPGRVTVVTSCGTLSNVDVAAAGGVAALAANSAGQVVACSWSGALTIIDAHLGTSTALHIPRHMDSHDSTSDDARRPPHSLAISDDGSIACVTGTAVHLFVRAGGNDAGSRDGDEDAGGWRRRVIACWRPPTQVTAVGPSEFAVAGEAAFFLSTKAPSFTAVRYLSAAHCCADGTVAVQRVSDASGVSPHNDAGVVAMALSDGTVAVGQAVPVAAGVKLPTGVGSLDTIPLAPVTLRSNGGGSKDAAAGTRGATPALLISSTAHPSQQSAFTCLVTWARAQRQGPVESRVYLLGAMLEPVAASWPPLKDTDVGMITAAAFLPSLPTDTHPLPVVAVAHGSRRVSLITVAAQTAETVTVAQLDLPGASSSIAALVAVAPSHDDKCRLFAVSRVGDIHVLAVATERDEASVSGGSVLTYTLQMQSAVPPLLPTSIVLDAALLASTVNASGAQRAPKWARTEEPSTPPPQGRLPESGGVSLLMLTRRSDGVLHVVAARNLVDVHPATMVVVAEYSASKDATSAAARLGDARLMQLVLPSPSVVHSVHWVAGKRFITPMSVTTRPGSDNGVLCRATPGAPVTWIDADDLVATALEPDYQANVDGAATAL